MHKQSDACDDLSEDMCEASKLVEAAVTAAVYTKGGIVVGDVVPENVERELTKKTTATLLPTPTWTK